MNEIFDVAKAISELGLSTVMSSVLIVVFIKQQNRNNQFFNDVKKALENVAKCISDKNMMSQDNFYDVLTDKIWISTTLAEQEIIKMIDDNNIEKYFEQLLSKIDITINNIVSESKHEIERINYNDFIKQKVLIAYRSKIEIYKEIIKKEFKDFLTTKDYELLKLNIRGLRSTVYNELSNITNNILKEV